MKLTEMYPSNWLGQADVPNPIVVTIKEIKREAIKGQRGTEVKTIATFTTNVKPWIVNKGNAKRLLALFGDGSENWIGKSIEIYTDPMVEFAGEIVGGLRLRTPSTNPLTGSAPATSHNGNGFVGRWDLSDGTKDGTIENLTAEDVRKTILDSGRPASAWKAKPAGAPREQAKTVDQLGICTALPPVEDVIPF